ncbi:MAG: AMP-binding protein [Acidimicrobiales bacterium]
MTFNLADLFERVVAAVPDREAVVCGSLRLTYGELDARAERVAGALLADGVDRGDTVGVALRNGTEYLELMLAAFKIGAVPVNVNYRYRPAELAHVLADSGAALVVHETDLTDGVAEVRDRLPRLRRTVARDAYDDWVDAARPATVHPPRSGDDPYVLYTGGTTGLPKGVVWRHEDVFFAAMGGGTRNDDPIERPDQIVERLADPPNRVLPASPLMHGTAQWFAFTTLFAGSSVVIHDGPTLDPATLLDLIDSEGVSYAVVVGDAFAHPLVEALDTHPDRWDLSTLTVVVSGGATLSAPVRRALLAHLPWIVVVDSYGTSETGGQASFVHTAGMSHTAGPARFDPRGETVVVDDRLRPVVPGSGTVGRVARFGHIPLGYHGDDRATAEVFPSAEMGRLAITGDQALVDEHGRIVLLGRGSSTINSGGEKIHPAEVEAVLREHPGVVDAVVVGVPDERWGERVGAVIAMRPGLSVPDEELRAHCRGHLADFKTPRSIRQVSRVHRTESGKPDHRWARQVLGT